jgi:integrase
MQQAKPRLLDVMRDRIRVKHYSYRTEKAYLGWVRRFIRFHNGKHPRELSGPEVESFLNHLAVDRRVSASTQNQALAGVLFLYREVLEVDLPWLDGLVRAKRPERVPVVLTREEVARTLVQPDGLYALVAGLLYGAGLRVAECLRLRVKDIDFSYGEIVVRDGKGQKDLRTMLSRTVEEPLW